MTKCNYEAWCPGMVQGLGSGEYHEQHIHMSWAAFGNNPDDYQVIGVRKWKVSPLREVGHEGQVSPRMHEVMGQLLDQCPFCGFDLQVFRVDPLCMVDGLRAGKMHIAYPIRHAQHVRNMIDDPLCGLRDVTANLDLAHAVRRVMARQMVWLDDERACPSGWVWVKTPQHCLELIELGTVKVISLDNDLQLLTSDGSREPRGKDVMDWIDSMARGGMIHLYDVPLIRIHTANSVDGAAMRQTRRALYSWLQDQGVSHVQQWPWQDVDRWTPDRVSQWMESVR